MKHFLKIFVSFFLIFTLLFGAAFYLYFERDESKKITEVSEKTEELDVKEKKERVNILLLGIDALNGDYEANVSRTDTMMLLSIDPKTDTAFILSIPRDSRVKIRGRQGMDKINHAHAYGGVDLALKTTKDFLQIPIHHYVRVDYQALFKTIDDIGGVEIDVPINMKYSDPRATPPLKIDLKKGKQILDGQKSMEYLRFRKGYANQDLGRINAQQEFIQAVLEKIISPSSIIRVPQYIETIFMYVDTDMTKKDMLELAKQGLRIKPSEIQKSVVPGDSATISGISYYKVNEEHLKTDLEFLMSGVYPSIAESEDSVIEDTNKDKIETNSTETNPQAVDDKKPNIIILNGSGKNGVATRASDLLKIKDYTIAKTGNADNFNYDETIIYYKENKSLAQTMKTIIGKGKLENQEINYRNTEADVIIVIGKDF